jgi:uncharacterized protein YqgC (DUF456 family)
VDLRSIPTGTLIFDIVLYVCLPLWLIMGFLDYYCHRRTGIEKTAGVKESIYHAIMGVQIGIPIFLGLYFQINVMILLLMFVALVFHEWVAHRDVEYARQSRQISMLEIHVHSFLETLPFFTVALLICINWDAFVDLITFQWAGHMGLHLRAQGINSHYIAAYVALLLFIDIIPYIEEFFRCWRHKVGTDKAPVPAGSREGE